MGHRAGQRGLATGGTPDRAPSSLATWVDLGRPNGRSTRGNAVTAECLSIAYSQRSEKLTGAHEVVHTYGWYLWKYNRDAKAKGITRTLRPQETVVVGEIRLDRFCQGTKQVPRKRAWRSSTCSRSS